MHYFFAFSVLTSMVWSWPLLLKAVRARHVFVLESNFDVAVL